jgi:hypothetical protein
MSRKHIKCLFFLLFPIVVYGQVLSQWDVDECCLSAGSLGQRFNDVNSLGESMPEYSLTEIIVGASHGRSSSRIKGIMIGCTGDETCNVLRACDPEKLIQLNLED